MPRIAVLVAAFFGSLAHADNREPIGDRSVRVIGYGATLFVEKIRAHNFLPEGIEVFGPDEEGDVTTTFVILNGWETLSKIPNAEERCDETCIADEGKELQMATTTIQDGDDIDKVVFLDAAGIAHVDVVLQSQGYVGCIAEQIAIEASWIWTDTAKCLAKIYGGMTTKRRKDTPR